MVTRQGLYIALLLGIALVTACATQPISPAPAISTLSPPLSSTIAPTVSGAACGTVEIRDAVILSPATAQGAQACFWQAYQRCASGQAVAVHRVGADGNGGISMYTVVSQGAHCRVHVDGYALPVTAAGEPGPGAYSFYDCSTMSRGADGSLVVSDCPNGYSQRVIG